MGLISHKAPHSTAEAVDNLEFKTSKKDGGVKGLSLTLTSDINRELTESYDVLTSEGVALRGIFIIENEQFIRSANINVLPIGRSIDEALGHLDAVQFHQAHGEVCPVNWEKGDQGMTTDSSGLITYFSD